MPRLDELIDQWVCTLGEAEPALRPHLDEIADHVRSDAQVRLSAGADVSDAFATAIGSFGAPRELAREFLKTEPSDERRALKFTAVYLAASLLVTATMIAIDKLVLPLNPLWFSIVWISILNPLLVLLFFTQYRKGRRRFLSGVD